MSTDIDAARATIETLRNILATDSRDWTETRGDAWLYAIILGWGPDPDDEDSTDTLPEIVARHGWVFPTTSRLRAQAASFAAIPALLDELAQLRARDATLVDPQEHERTVLIAAGQKLRAKADARAEHGHGTPGDTWHRAWLAAARHIEPEPTHDEIRAALHQTLSGMAGRVCHLDDAGRSIPPTDQTGATP